MADISVFVSETALATVHAAAAHAHPLETGGILVGVQARRGAWITHAIEIPTKERGHTTYWLPADATQQAVQRLRDTDPRVGYLGDWHSHPINAPASRTDRLTLAQTALGTRQPALLLVARRADDRYAIDVHRAAGIGVRRCTVVPAGDLQSLANESETDIE